MMSPTHQLDSGSSVADRKVSVYSKIIHQQPTYVKNFHRKFKVSAKEFQGDDPKYLKDHEVLKTEIGDMEQGVKKVYLQIQI